jgi:hypothetical protein
MKKLLLILVVLALAVPAGANVFIYGSKETSASISYDWGTWEQSKESETAFVIVEPNDTDATAGLWAIEVWKEKGKDGKTYKCAAAEEVGEVDLLKAQVGKKLMWVISSEGADSRAMLTGQAKPTKIGDETVVVATSLTGTSIWDESESENERDLGTAKVALKLNAKLTLSEYALSGSEAMDAIMKDLVEEGYIEADP